jgi:ABC-type amino acid transport substrate-binding protein
MSGWAPFMTINHNAEYEGFDVDVAKEIAQRLGKKLIIKDLGALSTLFIALERNKIDMVMSGLDITKARMNACDMIRYTGQNVTSYALLFWKEIPLEIRSLEDFKKIPQALICSEPGSAQEKFLDRYPFIQQKSLNKLDDMILDIRYGRSTAALMEPCMALRFVHQIPELKMLPIKLPQDFQTMGIGLALKKGSPLRTALTQILNAMRNDGTLEQLERRYGLDTQEGLV